MLRNANYIYDNILVADDVNSTLEYCKKAQVGVDLSVRNFKKLKSAGVILKSKSIVSDLETVAKEDYTQKGYNFTGWYLRPGSYILELNEGCNFGMNDTGYIILRSSFNRSGCTVVSAVWDPGYKSINDNGTIGPMAVRFNVDTPNGIYIEENARIAQLIVFENEDTTLYDGQFQGGNFTSKLV